MTRHDIRTVFIEGPEVGGSSAAGARGSHIPRPVPLHLEELRRRGQAVADGVLPVLLRHSDKTN